MSFTSQKYKKYFTLNHNGPKNVRTVQTIASIGRALKNYRYFHFIGVVRRHYRAFTRHSGYDVW